MAQQQQQNHATISYGIRRLILINSGMYDSCVFPVDSPLSICGENNSGKSTAINALQFLFLTDMRHMDFGKYDALQTRKFYFRRPGSYVLAELHLQHGYFVIGATGSGAASHYGIQHFAYRGTFDREDFEDNGRALGLDELLRGLQRRGIEGIKLQPQELRDMLLGIPGEHAFDITLFPLRGHKQRYVDAWINVFKNLLHMRNVNSQDLKQLLLSIFDIHLVASDIDFAAEYQRVNSQVNRLKNELDVLYRMDPHVKTVLEKQEHRQKLRGKLHSGYSKIRQELTSWNEKYHKERKDANSQLDAIEPRRREIASERQQIQKDYDAISKDIGKLENWLQDFNAVEKEFQLVGKIEDLDKDIDNLKQNRDEVVKKIHDGEQEDAAQIERDMAELNDRIKRIDRSLENWDRNLWNHLIQRFTPEELAQVFGLLNHQLLELPVETENGIHVEDAEKLDQAVRSCLECIHDGVYRGNGVTVPLDRLSSIDPSQYMDIATMKQDREDCRRKVDALEHKLTAAKQMKKLQDEERALSNKLEEKRTFRNRFAEHAQRRTEAQGKRQQHEELTAKQKACKDKLEKLREEERDLDRQARTLEDHIKDLDRRQSRVEDKQQYVQPLPPEEPEGDASARRDADWPDALEEMIDAYCRDLQNKHETDRIIQDKLDLIEQIGGGSYLCDGEKDCMQSLRDASESIPNQEALLEKEKQGAIVELGNSLKGLRDNFQRLQAEIAKFNRAINRRAISNLTKLEIRLERHEQVMTAIEELVNSGDYHLFADEKKASDAADTLYEWVKSHGRNLSLTHVFELCFVVFSQEGREVIYRNLDRIESHGTTITIKALINMHMMGHLLDENRGRQMRFPYYLDEAATIDPQNQDTLIEQGLNMGFVPILASVKPQVAATYCVKIDTPTDGHGIVINERDWVELEKKEAAGEEVQTSERDDHQNPETPS